MLAGAPVTIPGGGRQSRDFVFVEDVVRANLLAAEMAEADGSVFNVAGGQSISIQDLAQALRRGIPGAPQPVSGPPRPGEIRLSAAGLHRAEQALGYRPATGLGRGLAPPG